MEALKAIKIIGNQMMEGLCFYFFQIPGKKDAEKDAFKEKIIRCTVWELLNP